MKRSPLSTPRGQGGNFHRGRGRQRGYGYSQHQSRNNNNYQRFSHPYNDGNRQFGSNMIPLETDSPGFSHNNRGNRRQPNDRCNQRFSSSSISGSYNQGPNNHRNNFQANHGSPYSPQKFQRNQSFKMRHDAYSYRKMPVSEFVDIRSIFQDPWEELMTELEIRRDSEKLKTVTNDSSVEIICERKPLEDSSSTSISGEATINISGSSYEVREGSSLDLPLESMNFDHESKDSSVLSSSITSCDDVSLSEKSNRSQDDSVVLLN